MRALLLGFASLTLAVGWASQEASAVSPRARQVVCGVDDLVCFPREPEGSIRSAPAEASRVAPDETRDASGSPAPVVDDSLRIPVDLAVVDGETGAPLALATEITLIRADGLDVPRPPPPEQRDPEAPPPDSVPWAQGAAYAAPGTKVDLKVSFPAPDGYVADDKGAYAGSTVVSRRATRVRLLAPLRHEADVHVRILDSGGRPVSGARAVSAYMAGPAPHVLPGGVDETWEVPPPAMDDELVELGAPDMLPCRSVPSAADGWTRVRGLPHLLDERFWIVAREGQREGFAGITLGRFGEHSDAEIRMPAAASHVDRDLAYELGGCSG